jgi:hypothetical protein
VSEARAAACGDVGDVELVERHVMRRVQSPRRAGFERRLGLAVGVGRAGGFVEPGVDASLLRLHAAAHWVGPYFRGLRRLD